MLQLLEVLLVDSMDKELDLSQSFSAKIPVDLLPNVVDQGDPIEWNENVRCLLQGTPQK